MDEPLNSHHFTALCLLCVCSTQRKSRKFSGIMVTFTVYSVYVYRILISYHNMEMVEKTWELCVDEKKQCQPTIYGRDGREFRSQSWLVVEIKHKR